MRALRAFHRAASAAFFMACALLAAGCVSNAPTPHGSVQGAEFGGQELLQSEGNRLAGTAMQANLQSLLLLADKLYRRNPVQWRKTAASREAALLAIRQAVMQEADEAAGQEPPEQESASAIAWPALQGRRDVAALALTLSPDFTGDRVAAFIIACADTLITAHGGQRQFHYLSGPDPQHIYNAARNMEIALWILNTRRDSAGRPLLLANEAGPAGRNLSFEREFGKIIGRLDLVAAHLTERHRRAAISFLQGMAAAPLLTFLPVR